MTTELAFLRRRVEQLEVIERDYRRLMQLVNDARGNHDLELPFNEAVLYVHQATQRIVGANSRAVELLGFSQQTLCNFHIHDIEIQTPETEEKRITYQHSGQIEYKYPCSYRHRDGYIIEVEVYQRLYYMSQEDGVILYFTLNDNSLSQQVRHELLRREDSGFEFREKLKSLNEINLLLAATTSLHELCYQAIELGISKLKFDRLSIWLWDKDNARMVGTYGVDEHGHIRDERHSHWSYRGTYVERFISGTDDRFVLNTNAPIYNHRSEVVGYGWHISVPLTNRGQFIGFMSADNFINRRAMRDYHTELLRLYGVTLGHLTSIQLQHATVRKLSDAIQRSTSMIIIVDERAGIEFVNDAFYSLSGYNLEDVRGKPLEFLISTDEYPQVWQTLSLGQAWQGELLRQTRDGKTYEAMMSISPIESIDGYRNFIVVQEDITLLKQARKHEFELNLEQERVRMLEAFIRDIGHEFRTPLSVITLKSYLLQKVGDQERKDLLAQEIQEQVSSISMMLDDLLYMVKLESEHNKLTRSAVDVCRLVSDVTTSTENALADGNLTLTFDLPDTSPIINADAPRLARALHELIRNAIQYTPPWGTITLGVHWLNDGQQVGIWVKDTGIGIPPDELGRVFNRLYRVNQARTTRGTGLGLSIAKIIVEGHGGKIIVESVPYEGSTFEIVLPSSG